MELNSLLYPTLSLGGLGLLFGIILGYASKKFHVPVDERVPLVRDCLPGANCGGCGYAGCDAYAEAVVKGDAEANLCTVAGAVATEKIGKIMGVSVEIGEPKKAFVKCAGTCTKAKTNGEYYGEMDCAQAAIIPGGGNKSCTYGCLGLGTCVKACKFDAIHIVDGIAIVDEEKCTACGACTAVCPKNLIELKPQSSIIRVSCNSRDKLKEIKDVCNAGCITCGLCARNCPEGAITMENNLPVVDKDKCTLCMTCIQKCPTKVIGAHGDKIELKETL